MAVMRWWQAALIIGTLPVSLVYLWRRRRCRSRAVKKAYSMPVSEPISEPISEPVTEAEYESEELEQQVRCCMQVALESETESEIESEMDVEQLLSEPPVKHRALPRSINLPTLRPNKKKLWVGCAAPDEEICPGEWNQVDAVIFTDKTLKRISNELIAGAKAAHDIDRSASITVKASSPNVEIDPPVQTGLRIIRDFMRASFYYRLPSCDVMPNVTFEFYAGNVNVPFGVVCGIIRPGQQLKTPSANSVCVIAHETDRHIKLQITDAMSIAGVEIQDDPELAARIVYVHSKFFFDPQTRHILKNRTDVTTVAYTDVQSLEHLPSYLEKCPRRFYSNSLEKLSSQVQSVQDKLDQHMALLKQCLDMLRANHRAICDAAGAVCPSQFQVWPTERPRGIQRLNPRNWVSHRFRLHLLCEGSRAYNGDGEHYVFDQHPGYTIDVPKKWFAKWGKLLMLSIKIMCMTAKVAVAATGAGGLGELIPLDFTPDIVKQALPLLDIAVTDSGSLRELVQSRASDMLGDLDEILEAEQISQDGNPEETFAALRQFLAEGKPMVPEMAGLIRCFHAEGMPDSGRATWVCAKHAHVINSYTEPRRFETMV